MLAKEIVLGLESEKVSAVSPFSQVCPSGNVWVQMSEGPAPLSKLQTIVPLQNKSQQRVRRTTRSKGINVMRDMILNENITLLQGEEVISRIACNG